MRRHRSTATAPVLHVRFSLCGLNSRPLPHFRAQNRPKTRIGSRSKIPMRLPCSAKRRRRGSDKNIMLKLESEVDSQRLVADQVKESLTLDYKASPALGRTDGQRNELCKDVTAFANSAGG